MKENEASMEKCYLLTEEEIREEVRKILWEFSISKLLNEYAGANENVRKLTIQIVSALKQMRPLEEDFSFMVDSPDSKGKITINIINNTDFFRLFKTDESNYNVNKKIISLRRERINDENWVGYVYESLMHEFNHALQFQDRSQMIDYRNRVGGKHKYLASEIGYLFNPYEIGARVSSADYYFRVLINGLGLDSESLSRISFQDILKVVKNNLQIEEMKNKINELKECTCNEETASLFLDVCTTFNQSTKSKAENVYNTYISTKDRNPDHGITCASVLKNMALKYMEKELTNYMNKLQKMWEYLITDYNGRDFQSYYIQ